MSRYLLKTNFAFGLVYFLVVFVYPCLLPSTFGNSKETFYPGSERILWQSSISVFNEKARRALDLLYSLEYGTILDLKINKHPLLQTGLFGPFLTHNANTHLLSELILKKADSIYFLVNLYSTCEFADWHVNNDPTLIHTTIQIIHRLGNEQIYPLFGVIPFEFASNPDKQITSSVAEFFKTIYPCISLTEKDTYSDVLQLLPSCLKKMFMRDSLINFATPCLNIYSESLGRKYFYEKLRTENLGQSTKPYLNTYEKAKVYFDGRSNSVLYRYISDSFPQWKFAIFNIECLQDPELVLQFNEFPEDDLLHHSKVVAYNIALLDIDCIIQLSRFLFLENPGSNFQDCVPHIIFLIKPYDDPLSQKLEESLYVLSNKTNPVDIVKNALRYAVLRRFQ